MDSRSILNIAPANEPAVRDTVAALRQHPGLWEQLCRASLWQTPTFAGRPVHNETSALCAIVNHLGSWETGCHELADRFLAAVGKKRIQALIESIGVSALDQEPWRYWMRVTEGDLNSPPAPEKFADGWGLRNYRRNNVGFGNEHQEFDPKEILPTGEDEKVLWCWDDVNGQVYPLVY